MKTMRQWWVAGGLAVALGWALPGAADTVKLTDGTVLEGDITAETTYSVTINVEFSGGTIRQKREIPRTEIAEIKRLTADEKRQAQMQKDYQTLLKSRLDPSRSFSVAQYDETINKVFQAFLTLYPNSPYESQVIATMQAWQAERDRVAAGEAKYKGQWLPAAAAAALAEKDRGTQLLETARSLMEQGKLDQAIPPLEQVAALKTQPALTTEARDLLTTVYQKMCGIVDAQLAQLQQAAVTARANVAKARKALTDAEQKLQQQRRRGTENQYQAMGERGAAFMETQTKLVGLRTSLTDAENQLWQIESQLSVTQQKSAKLRQVASQTGIQLAAPPQVPVSTGEEGAEAGEATAMAAASASSEPVGAPKSQEPLDVLANAVQWCKDRWMLLAGGGLIALWLLSRAMR